LKPAKAERPSTSLFVSVFSTEKSSTKQVPEKPKPQQTLVNTDKTNSMTNLSLRKNKNNTKPVS
jgi:hypothetical protein